MRSERGFSSLPRSAEHGFTLIEVMVALAVFSLAILALVRLQGAGVRGAGLVDEALVAQMVARNVALAAYTEPQPPIPGRATGVERNGRSAWRWTRQVSSLGDAGVTRIDVAVQNRAGQVVGRLTVVRPPGIAS
jgi:general secretion pathway protein I